MVFCGLFPVDTDQFPELRDALEKLALNDAALAWEPETSQALGFGFRCGFLGLLHMDIVRERLEREYDLELLATTPNVEYEVTLTDGDEVERALAGRHARPRAHRGDPRALHPRDDPVPEGPVGAVMELCQDRRGTPRRHELPLRAARCRSTTTCRWPRSCSTSSTSSSRARKGYASLDYELLGMRAVRPRQARHPARRRPGRRAVDGRPQGQGLRRRPRLAERLRKQIPRQQFEVAIQAAIGSKIIARESVKAVRKDVIAKCYGGDITRKSKLLEKQKEGKKRMKQVGPHRGAAGGVPLGAHARRRLSPCVVGDNGSVDCASRRPSWLSASALSHCQA